jgi:hypothetical protein
MKSFTPSGGTVRFKNRFEPEPDRTERGVQFKVESLPEPNVGFRFGIQVVKVAFERRT